MQKLISVKKLAKDGYHTNFNQLRLNDLVVDSDVIRDIKTPKNSFCDVCVQSKLSRKPFQKSKDKTRITRPLQTISSDVGTIKKMTMNSERYILCHFY